MSTTEEDVSMTEVSAQQHKKTPEPGASAEAPVDLVVRGMYRGELSPSQRELVAAGFAIAKGPLIVPRLALVENLDDPRERGLGHLDCVIGGPHPDLSAA